MARKATIRLQKTKAKGAASKRLKRATPTSVNATRRPNHADDGDLDERILDHGEEVAYQDWDSGGAGAGGGRESIYRYGRKFYHLHDAGMQGPYPSLASAVKAAGIDEINSATVQIWHHDKGVTFDR